jgi:putative hydrolase of the HAD superfamily
MEAHAGNAPAVLFDLVGTLIAVRSSVGTQYARLAAQFGIEVLPEALDKAFPPELAAAPPLVFPGRTAAEVAELEKEVWRGIVRRVLAEAGALAGFEAPAFARYFDALFEHFSTGAGWRVYPDVVGALERVRQAGWRTGLVSNFDSRVFPLLERLDLSRLLDVIAVPAVAFAEKPDARIFRFALRALGAEASRGVVVGDSIREDVEAARQAGLEAILIARDDRLPPPPPGVNLIRSLDEIDEVLFR